jgi:hypothetical protein
MITLPNMISNSLENSSKHHSPVVSAPASKSPGLNSYSELAHQNYSVVFLGPSKYTLLHGRPQLHPNTLSSIQHPFNAAARSKQ